MTGLAFMGGCKKAVLLIAYRNKKIFLENYFLVIHLHHRIGNQRVFHFHRQVEWNKKDPCSKNLPCGSIFQIFYRCKSHEIKANINLLLGTIIDKIPNFFLDLLNPIYLPIELIFFSLNINYKCRYFLLGYDLNFKLVQKEWFNTLSLVIYKLCLLLRSTITVL